MHFPWEFRGKVYIEILPSIKVYIEILLGIEENLF